MIKHLVMFKFKNSPDKFEIAREIKKELESLVNVIECLKSMEVHINTLTVQGQAHEDYDLVLIGTFNNMDDVHSYAVNPHHLKVVDKIKENAISRSAIDYEI